jgi:hypothetical protein
VDEAFGVPPRGMGGRDRGAGGELDAVAGSRRATTFTPGADIEMYLPGWCP